ncbi:MAG: DUF6188 family protein [Anaerolineae bacterium]|jgi:hypothetical protein|nr:DUF6188 family protein [Anaerolineae bacterium]
MTWQDIRAAYPDRWALIKVHRDTIETPEHLRATTTRPYITLIRLEVIADFEDDSAAHEAYQRLRGQPKLHEHPVPNSHEYHVMHTVMHTSLEQIDAIEHDDHWRLPLVGCICVEVSYQRYPIELKFEKHDDRFSFDPIFHATAMIETALDDATKARLIGLVGQTVISAVATHAGELGIAFDDGGDLRVPADPDFESWQISGSFGLMIISLPGGGLAVW